MDKWVDNRLDLGALGHLSVWQWNSTSWDWDWTSPGGLMNRCQSRLPTEVAARRSAESWMRRALKQASKRLEAK